MSGDTRAVLDGRDEVRAAWRELLLGLASHPSRELWLVDTDFSDWPLSDPGVLDALTLWARRPVGTLRMMGRGFDQMPRAHPRFAQWRRDWAHRFEAWTPIEGELAELPSVLLAEGGAVEVFDRLRWRGRSVSGAPQMRALIERCEADLQRCEPAWPATTLGL